tara:strand:- start:1227 stop:1859 length:633 start_codon:yes stop_codon:yes gene_type:complete
MRIPNSKIKIMIVEDEVITARSEKQSLEELGYCVSFIAVSGEEAVKKAEEDKPNLVLMDIELKGKMDGIETAGIMRSRFDIPSIFVTAYADDKLLRKAKIVEPFGYLIKPFENKELLSNIEIALYKHRAENERKELIKKLQGSLAKVKLLSGLIPICANCKDIRDDEGDWQQIEDYIQTHTDAQFSHGICLKCSKKLYPEFYDKNDDTEK